MFFARLSFVGHECHDHFRYLLGRLKTLCEEAIRKSITLETVCTIFLLAHKHNAEGLKASDCHHFGRVGVGGGGGASGSSPAAAVGVVGA